MKDEPAAGSASVAMRRLSHPRRDGGPAAVGDAISEVSRRLAELLAIVENGTNAEPIESEDHTARRLAFAPASPAWAPSAPHADDTGTATVTLRLDSGLLARIDADAKRLGISRTSWLQRVADERLKGQR